MKGERGRIILGKWMRGTFATTTTATSVSQIFGIGNEWIVGKKRIEGEGENGDLQEGPFFCRRFPGKWKGYYGNLSTISHLQLVRLSPVRDRVRPDIDADGADEVVVGGAVKELLQEARLANAGVAHHNLLDEQLFVTLSRPFSRNDGNIIHGGKRGEEG